jgi:hypothetical protein
VHGEQVQLSPQLQAVQLQSGPHVHGEQLQLGFPQTGASMVSLLLMHVMLRGEMAGHSRFLSRE